MARIFATGSNRWPRADGRRLTVAEAAGSSPRTQEARAKEALTAVASVSAVPGLLRERLARPAHLLG